MRFLAGIKILHSPSRVSTDTQSQGAAQRCTVLCRGMWERAWVLLLPGRSYTHLPVVLPAPPPRITVSWRMDQAACRPGV